MRGAELAVRGHGKSASEVIEIAQELVQMREHFSSSEFDSLCVGTGWHSKVISKLLAIGRDRRLLPLVLQLPSSYSAIYPLTTLTDEELNLSVSEQICRPSVSSREVLDWIRMHRVEGKDFLEAIAFVGTSLLPLSPENKASLLADIQKVALLYGVKIVDAGVPGAGSRRLRKISRETKAEKLLRMLEGDLLPVLKACPAHLLEQFGVSSSKELALGEVRTFTGLLVRLAGGTEKFWSEYGMLYCNKIAFEFNRTDSRAQRFNYRKRLLEIKARHLSLGAHIKDLLREYIS